MSQLTALEIGQIKAPVYHARVCVQFSLLTTLPIKNFDFSARAWEPASARKAVGEKTLRVQVGGGEWVGGAFQGQALKMRAKSKRGAAASGMGAI